MSTESELEKRCSALERKFRDIVIGGSILSLACIIFLGFTWMNIPGKVKEALESSAIKKIELEAKDTAKRIRAIEDQEKDTAKRIRAIEDQAKDTAKRIGAIKSQAESMLKHIEELHQHANSLVYFLGRQPTFKWKSGNNGTVSCDNYCADVQKENFAGTCVSAVINKNDWAKCNLIPNGPVHCLCVTR